MQSPHLEKLDAQCRQALRRHCRLTALFYRFLRFYVRASRTWLLGTAISLPVSLALGPQGGGQALLLLWGGVSFFLWLSFLLGTALLGVPVFFGGLVWPMLWSAEPRGRVSQRTRKACIAFALVGMICFLFHPLLTGLCLQTWLCEDLGESELAGQIRAHGKRCALAGLGLVLGALVLVPPGFLLGVAVNSSQLPALALLPVALLAAMPACWLLGVLSAGLAGLAEILPQIVSRYESGLGLPLD